MKSCVNSILTINLTHFENVYFWYENAKCEAGFTLCKLRSSGNLVNCEICHKYYFRSSTSRYRHSSRDLFSCIFKRNWLLNNFK